MPFMKLKARQIDLRAPCLEKGESEREGGRRRYSMGA